MTLVPTRGRKKSIMENFTQNLLQALLDEEVVMTFEKIFEKVCKKIYSKTNEAIAELQTTVVNLHKRLDERDAEIASLKKQNGYMIDRIDELEQYSRRPSIRVYGIPEETPGTTDSKLLKLCNAHLKLRPPLELSDIEVSHRVGKPRPLNADSSDGQSQTPPPRAIIAWLASRRTKARIMAAYSKLRFLGPKRGDEGDGTEDETTADGTNEADSETEDTQDFPNPVYISDDLTQKRAKLAQKCRQLKQDKIFLDTWIFDGRVLAKDLHQHKHEIKNEDILREII